MVGGFNHVVAEKHIALFAVVSALPAVVSALPLSSLLSRCHPREGGDPFIPLQLPLMRAGSKNSLQCHF